MKEMELHIQLPFSYWLDRDPESGIALQKPDERSVADYLMSLAKEMGSMKTDYQDCQVTRIRFMGGYLSLLDAEDLERLLILIHRSFSVCENCPVNGVFFPGQADMEMISCYRNHNVSPFLFEVPSLSYNECKAMGYPMAMQALDKTVYLLQNYSESEWGLRLPIGMAGRSKSSWEYLLGQMYHYSPKYLQFFRLSTDTQEDLGFAQICSDLESHGYCRIAENLYATEEVSPAFVIPEPDTEYVGIGLGARSRIDGFLVANTADPALYKSRCVSYRKLIANVQEIQFVETERN